MNEFFKYLLTIFGTTVVVVIVCVYIGLDSYTKLKVLLGDILRFFGWVGKTVRKKSVSSEFEGTINGIIKDFNTNFETPILPNCKIEWITSENKESVLQTDKAIVCLSFDKNNHDLNFYNATYNYIKIALVAKAKPFLKKSTSKAIDLLSTKIILREYRREVLHTFNKKFVDVEPETKDAFHRLDETDQNGLYSNFLVPEFHHLGELLNERTPNISIENDIERFLEWFYKLATRDFNEKSILKYEGTNIKIGVILVAKLTTYNQYGAEAYTKWAEKYASEHYNAVYLLSKGENRNSIAREVAEILINSKGFNQVNKNTIVKRPGIDGKPMLITCICLRPDPTTIRYNAWEFVKQKFQANENVIGIIQIVTKDNIIVNVAGLQSVIFTKELSEAVIPDATKLFRENQELELKILECHPEEEKISLSNVGTKTDPKILIDSNLSNDKPITTIITKIQKDKDNLEKGIIVKCKNPEVNVFIPRSKTTRSRFTDISKKFQIGGEVQIVLEEFNFDYGNYSGKLFDLINPWETDQFNNLRNGTEVSVIVKEIQERFLTCEISEGLECKLFVNEISWDETKCNTKEFKIDDELKVKIVAIDKDNKRISVSLRQFSPSPVKQFFNEHINQIINAKISLIDERNGIHFVNESLNIKGFVHWSELVWGNIYPVSDNFQVGDLISVKAISYKEDYNSIQYSVKRCLQHQYEEFFACFNTLDYVTGKILVHYAQMATVQITYNGLVVQGYIHKSNLSNCCFLNSSDIPLYLPHGETFGFVVGKIDVRNQIIELSRKKYLEENKEIKLGESYNVFYTKSYKGKSYFYSNDLEGYISERKSKYKVGEKLEVIPIHSDSDEFEISE